MRADRSISAERAEKSMTADPAFDGPARSLAGRVISRRQALGLAGGALAGVATLASMPKAASAARVASSSAVLESLSDVPSPLTLNQGNFGRLFPQLPAFASDTPEVRKNLLELGKQGGIMDAGDTPPPKDPSKDKSLTSLAPNVNNPNNATHSAGVTFLGQFLDHDITFDPTSSLLSQVDPTTVANFRTVAFDLDSVYGLGRRANPHLYDQTSPDSIKLLIDEEAPKDVPRNSQNIAITGDPRNDENLIISQLHLAFLKFHNAVIDEVLGTGDNNPSSVFDKAQQLVRWHYQWIILNEFLPKTVGQVLLDDVLKNGTRFYNFGAKPFIPVEFSVAAYRFGHSQVRPGYIANFDGDNRKPFVRHIFNLNTSHEVDDPEDLSGGKRAPRRFVDWRTFFDVGPTPAKLAKDLGASPKPNKQIDAKLSSPLFQLPFGPPNDPQTLAQRNLLRHLTFSLPSGQAVANAMGIDPLSTDNLKDVGEMGFADATPLWFYILKESKVNPDADGETLGPVGGRIVAEVFIGILQNDPMAYLHKDPNWEPTLGPNKGDFKMADLLDIAGVLA